MPLKSILQINSLDEYKKLVKTDAAALKPGSGVAFQAFSKFTFPDKTSSAVILFGLVPPVCTEAVKTRGKGKAVGTASINSADEIELEVASGDVDYPGLSLALGKSGVTRKLRVPLQALTPGNGTTAPKVGTALPSATKPPTIGKRPGTPPPTNAPQQPRPLPRPQPTTNSGNNSTTTNKSATPVVPNQRPLAKPGAQGPVTNAPQVGVKPPTTNPPQTKPPQQPPTSKPPLSVKTTPTAPNNKPPQRPVAPEEKAFRAGFANLKARYEIALSQNPTSKSLQLIFTGMLTTAKSGDFKGALLLAGKLDGEIAQWNRASFQKAKQGQQEKRAARLTDTLGAVKRSYFTPGTADRLAQEKLSAGTHFKAFLKAQKDFETARDEQSLQQLEAMAKAYQKHFADDFGSKDQQKKENVRKLALCSTALKQASHFRIALEQDKLGNPPWDEEKEMRSAEIYSKMLFEQDDKLATPNDPGAGVNGAFWIEKTVWGDKPQENDVKKTFIFKPVDAESLVAGYPQGGSVARELLGKSVGDQLQAQMGLDFGVPETTVIAVDSSKIPDEHGKPGPTGVPRVGSIQHFEKSKGELKKLMVQDPSFIKSIPDEEVEKMAVLDLIQLNTDRHSGNFMVGESDNGQGGKKPRLVPIDNGLCMPSIEGLRGRRAKLGSPHAVLGETPGAQKKMSPQTVARIQAIDPDEVIAGMKRSFGAMKKLHPEAAQASQITDANFELTKRSILFLKKASTELTIAEIQDAYVSSLEEIFDSAPDQMEAGFNKAVQNVKDRKQALQELDTMKDQMGQMHVELQALGWGISVSNQAFDAWVKMNPAKVLKIRKDKTVNPLAVKKLTEMRTLLKGHPDENKTMGKGLGQDILTLSYPVNALRNKKALLYGEDKPTALGGDRAEAFEELGGTTKLQQLDPAGKAKTLEEKANLLMQEAITALGGEPVVTKLKGLYPQSKLTTPLQKYQGLKAWKEYEALGGDVQFYRAGGGVENTSITERLVELKDMTDIYKV